MISHRSGDFSAIYSDCCQHLKEFFETKNDIVVMTGSGTVGMDGAVASLIGREDKIVTISNGKFGERFTGDRRAVRPGHSCQVRVGHSLRPG